MDQSLQFRDVRATSGIHPIATKSQTRRIAATGHRDPRGTYEPLRLPSGPSWPKPVQVTASSDIHGYFDQCHLPDSGDSVSALWIAQTSPWSPQVPCGVYRLVRGSGCSVLRRRGPADSARVRTYRHFEVTWRSFKHLAPTCAYFYAEFVGLGPPFLALNFSSFLVASFKIRGLHARCCSAERCGVLAEDRTTQPSYFTPHPSLSSASHAKPRSTASDGLLPCHCN
jgi:hypothetical protein